MEYRDDRSLGCTALGVAAAFAQVKLTSPSQRPFETQECRTLPESGAAHQEANEPADEFYTALHRTH